MNMEWEKGFIKKHPLKIKDTDLFIHGTSSKNYSAIQRTGFLLRNVPIRNWKISTRGIRFERYPKSRISFDQFVDHIVERYCKPACEKTHSSEGVVLQIKGRELNEIGCCVKPDSNMPLPYKYDSEGIPIGLNSNYPYLTIIITDRDIPLRCLEVIKRVPITVT